MDVAIIGGHGQVARLLARRLVARGDTVRAVVRRPGQTEDVEQDGSRAVLHDLEVDDDTKLAAAMDGADAVVFAAGSGPGSGAERKWTVDHAGAVHTLAAARAADVPRFVIVSSMGTDDPPSDDEVFSVYLRAKAAADADVMASDRAWTVVRPGGLTDESATGRVAAARHVDRGQIPRDDVAAVLAACLHDDASVGRVFEVVSGDTPVQDAITSL